MASTIYPIFKQELLKHTPGTSLSAGTVKFVMVSSAYTYSADHRYKSSLAGIMQDSTGAAEASLTVTTKYFDQGVFATNNTPYTFTAPAASLTSYIAMVFYIDSGSPATSPLVAYIDGFSVVPNGGDINILWDDLSNINGITNDIIFAL